MADTDKHASGAMARRDALSDALAHLCGAWSLAKSFHDDLPKSKKDALWGTRSKDYEAAIERGRAALSAISAQSPEGIEGLAGTSGTSEFSRDEIEYALQSARVPGHDPFAPSPEPSTSEGRQAMREALQEVLASHRAQLPSYTIRTIEAALAQPQGAGPSERGSNNEPPPRGPHRPPSEDWHYDSQGYCDNPGRGY